MNQTLSQRQLNRALLARQGLLERKRVPALEMIEALVGMQSQAPQAPYIGLWSRIAEFEPGELDELMTTRQVVRLTMMRGTVHLVSAKDCIALRPVIDPVILRIFLVGRKPINLDLEQVKLTTMELLAGGPLPAAEISARLAKRHPAHTSTDLLFAAHCVTAMVQIPPRGLWKQSGQPINISAESWIGQPLVDDADPEPLLRRYLSAFGPATIRDMQSWSGLQRLRESVEAMRPTLRTFHDEKGQELFDVPDGLLPDPATPAPVRIIAEFDNLVLGHADRTRVIDDEHRPAVVTINGQVRSTYLIDGYVAGMTKLTRAKNVATLTITPFVRLSTRDRAGLLAEADRLLQFAEPDATSNQIILG